MEYACHAVASAIDRCFLGRDSPGIIASPNECRLTSASGVLLQQAVGQQPFVCRSFTLPQSHILQTREKVLGCLGRVVTTSLPAPPDFFRHQTPVEVRITLTPSSKLPPVPVACESELLVHIDGQLYNMPEKGQPLDLHFAILILFNSIDPRRAIKAADVTVRFVNR